ncbi:MAG: hypothetical protein PHV04_09625 [Clostridia bacterium]|jgi:rubredoxin|nr:hypothetical protein [Clostridia bacterium]
MIDEEIKCPECGGNLVFWKEYLVTKTRNISKNGTLSKRVKTTTPDHIIGMEGFQCNQCKWLFNTVDGIEKMDKYPHLMDWIEEHECELKV